MIDAIARLVTTLKVRNPAAVDRVIVCLLARGHILIEDVPGVGKTVLATAMAKSIDCSFSRIQLTPDLLPSDVLGVSIYDRTTGEFLRPARFATIVLADEINRHAADTDKRFEAMNDGLNRWTGPLLSSRSWWWRRRTPTSSRAPTRSRRPSSTGS
jgi:MoxR-like ATPase